MKKDLTEQVETWLIRLVIIQSLVLIIGQVLITHMNWTPYLNKAVQSEGVLKRRPTDTINTMEPSPAVWYDKQTKSRTK